ILFLSHRYPFPPHRGDKIRAYHFLKHFGGSHEVWLAALADGEANLPFDVEGIRDTFIAKHSSLARLSGMGWAALSGGSLSVGAFASRELAQWVRQFVARVEPDVIFVFSSAMAQFLPRDLPARCAVLVDFVDVDSEKFRQYALAKRGLSRVIFDREAKKL